ncbi:PKD domain-containing protein [Paraflavisolibacter sp. H34]|uniref:PKD domain-containing protein n=1 Tax=Huijunlia imazamoxiresistens TaxID=3127457 RepID=UPI003015FCC9
MNPSPGCRCLFLFFFTLVLCLGQVRVSAQSTPDFSASTVSGCAPLLVHFTDKSGGNPSEWRWSLGNGVVSVLQNPSTTYSNPGTYTIKLVVRSASGADSVVRNAFITVYPNPDVAFRASDSLSCPPLSVQFRDLTTTGSGRITNWSWDFGDGVTATTASPTHVYQNAGNFTVTLKATNNYGCFKAFSKPQYIQIGERSQPDFTFAIPDKCGDPATVQFTNTSTAPAGNVFTWHFGDGTTSQQKDPVKTFATGKTYTVKLVSASGSCADSVSKAVTVSTRPAPAFSATGETSSCKAPFTVSFKNTTAGTYTYKWLFGDGGSSTQAQPSYTYKAPGLYTVRLIVFYGSGCSDTLTRSEYIRIQQPAVTLSGLQRTGCTPLAVKPTATIANQEAIVSYLWDFGDGTTSTQSNPTHTYTRPGNFAVTLTVGTSMGCTSTTTVADAVRVGNKPDADFTFDIDGACALTPIQFSDRSTGAIDRWLWKFGALDSSSEKNPVHKFQNGGAQSVTLVVWSNTCSDTLYRQNAVIVKPPSSDFTLKNDCSDKYKKEFTDKSTGAASWSWDFGDGTTSTERNPVHTYAAKGTYKVTLTSTSGGCSGSKWQTVNVIDENATFTADKEPICADAAVRFSSTVTNPGLVSRWLWRFGDGGTASTAGTAARTYKNPGKFTASLTITDLVGCESRYETPVSVYGPTAVFSLPATSACLGKGPVTFRDQSEAYGTTTIARKIWAFGDGKSDSSGQPSVQYTYTKTGSYTVSLTVVDNFGCSNKVSQKSLVVTRPKAAFQSPDTLSCIGSAVRFLNQSDTLNNATYKWTFGDNATATGAEPVHRYAAEGSFAVRLVAADKYGCTDTALKPAYVRISMPKADFSVSDEVGNCPPLLVQFTHSATNYNRLEWLFDDGNNSTLANPAHYYTLANTYYPKLVAFGPGGCSDTADKKILVKGPKGNFSYTNLLGCTPLKVDFKATASDYTSIVWDYRDGATLTTRETSVVHTYVPWGSFAPKMILTDESGCSVYIPGKDTIRVMGVEASFSQSQATLCGSGNVTFTGTTNSNDPVAAYEWTFGDGGTAAVKSPVHAYAAAGDYPARFIARTQAGCADTALSTAPLKVYEKPDVAITGEAASCLPAHLSFAGQVVKGNAAALQWNWTFGNGQTARTATAPAQVYSKEGKYTITAQVTDEHGCKDTATKLLTVHPLPATNAGPNRVLCRNNTLQFNVTGATRYSWREDASLNCLDCPAPVASPTQDATYVVIGTNEFGCTKADTVLVRVRQPFTLAVGPADTICAGESARLSASGAENYAWSPTTGLDNPASATPRAQPTVTTRYTVKAFDNDNCLVRTDSVLVAVGSKPSVELGPGISATAGSSVPLRPATSADVSSWKWVPATYLSCADCPAPVATPKEPMKYKLEVANAYGCTNSDEVSVAVVCTGGNLFLPNTFSPNGDGRNDVFYPRGSGISNIRSLKVYNRWGELVFERRNFNSNDASSGWDGTYKGKKLAPDTFIYFCEAVCSNNEVLPYKGDVTLLR